MKYQILHGAHVATFFVSDDHPPIYHAVITTQDSPAFIDWIQHHSQEQCERLAVNTMRNLIGLKDSNLLMFPSIKPRITRLRDRSPKFRKRA